MESKSRDEYREEAILWLHRQRAYEDKLNMSFCDDLDDGEVWADLAEGARLKVALLASLAGLESIEELEE